MPRNNAKITISAEDKTKQAFDSISTRLGGIVKVSGAATLAAGAGLVAIAKQTADFNDNMIKTAQAVGTSSEELSALTYAARLGGVEFDELSKGMGRLAKTTEDYRDGLKTSVDAFNKLDLDPTQFNDTSKLFEAVAEQLSKLPDGAQKSAIAMSLLGRSGAKLIPLMNGGADAIREAKEEAAAFGLVVDEQVARQSEQFNDNITRLQGAIKGLKTSIGNDAIPALVEITDAMALAAKESGLLKAAWIGLGGVAANAFGLDFVSQQRDRIREVKGEISSLQLQIRRGTVRAGVPFNDDELQSRLLKLRDYGLELAKLEKSIAPKAKQSKPSGGADDSPVVLTNSASTNRQAKEVERLVKQIEKAVQPTRSQSEALQAQLDAYRGLQPQVRGYLQGLVDQVEAQEQATKSAQEWQELSDLQRASDDEALRQLEALSVAEVQRVEAMQQQAKTIKELYDPTLKLLDLQFEYQQLLSEGLITQEEYDYALQKAKESMTDFSDEGQEAFKELKREIEGFSRDAADALVDFALTGEASFGDMVASILQDMARLAVKRNITDPLFENIGNIFGANSDGGFGDVFSSIFGGFRAAGGPVSSGKAYVVGENGPEILTGASGRIIPNHALSGGSNVVVNIIGASQAPTVKKTQTADGGTNIDVVFDMIKGNLVKDIRSDGEFAQAIEDQYSLSRAGGGF